MLRRAYCYRDETKEGKANSCQICAYRPRLRLCVLLTRDNEFTIMVIYILSRLGKGAAAILRRPTRDRIVQFEISKYINLKSKLPIPILVICNITWISINTFSNLQDTYKN